MGNHSTFFACGPAGAPTLLPGSHPNPVLHSGRSSGPLGVLSTLEALHVMPEANVSLSEIVTNL